MLSKLKDILGRYPKSSSIVKRGKNIAIGGSITATTHEVVWYIPKTSKSVSHWGEPKASNHKSNFSCIIPKKWDRAIDG